MKDIIKVTKDDLALVDHNQLSRKQLAFIMQRTPDAYKRTRPAKGGGTWTYVSGGYIRKVLNLMFGWDWDFEIVNEIITDSQVIVKGKLTCRSNGQQIVKMQYGRKDVLCKKGTTTPLDLGNDLKAAATDSLKKCAAELGIAADVYAPEEFREVDVVDQLPDLDPGTPEWDKAVRGLKAGTITLEYLGKRFNINSENLKTLEDETI